MASNSRPANSMSAGTYSAVITSTAVISSAACWQEKSQKGVKWKYPLIAKQRFSNQDVHIIPFYSSFIFSNRKSSMLMYLYPSVIRPRQDIVPYNDHLGIGIIYAVERIDLLPSIFLIGDDKDTASISSERREDMDAVSIFDLRWRCREVFCQRTATALRIFSKIAESLLSCLAVCMS